MTTKMLMTEDDLLRMPDDGYRYELIEGVLHRMSPGGLEHSDIGSEVLVRLRGFVGPRNLGLVVGADAGFWFGRDPDTVRAPDVAFVRAERLPPREQWKGYSDVVPDLAVEVVSRSDRRSDVDAKIAFYLAAGVPLVWRFEPRPRQVLVYRQGRDPIVLGVGDVLDGEDVVPGFRLPVADVFR